MRESVFLATALYSHLHPVMFSDAQKALDKAPTALLRCRWCPFIFVFIRAGGLKAGENFRDWQVQTEELYFLLF